MKPSALPLTATNRIQTRSSGFCLQGGVLAHLKKKHNKGALYNLFYWRDNKGVEIDLLIDAGGKLFPIEIKSSHSRFNSQSLTI